MIEIKKTQLYFFYKAIEDEYKLGDVESGSLGDYRCIYTKPSKTNNNEALYVGKFYFNNEFVKIHHTRDCDAIKIAQKLDLAGLENFTIEI